MALAHPDVHRITSEEYDRMVRSGALEDLRVELLDALLVDVKAPSPEHVAAVQALMRLLAGRLDLLRIQQPLACAEGWQPQPDVALTASEGPTRHPRTAHLAVEVIVTQRREAELKLPGYGLARIPVVWLVDVPARTVEILTGPRDDGFAARTTARAGDLLDPGVPGLEPFTVRELFAAAGLHP